MHRPLPKGRRFLAVQEVQEMTADRIVVGLDFYAPTGMRKVIPVEQHRTEAGHHPVGKVARLAELVVQVFRKHGTQSGTPGAQDVHGVRVCRDALQDVLNRRR